jgi:hypothetical protein
MNVEHPAQHGRGVLHIWTHACILIVNGKNQDHNVG